MHLLLNCYLLIYLLCSLKTRVSEIPGQYKKLYIIFAEDTCFESSAIISEPPVLGKNVFVIWNDVICYVFQRDYIHFVFEPHSLYLLYVYE